MIVNYKSEINKVLTSDDLFLLNFGPQHPAAHGVLRLILKLNGELICEADPHIGLLHRGTEKLMESKTYNQIIPYFDRLDYVSTMAQEHAYALIVEKLLNYNQVDPNIRYIRIMYSEITRILNHLLAISCHALDVGAMTPFLWAFEDREKLMQFYEEICGSRLHAAYIRPGGVFNEDKFISNLLLDSIEQFTLQFPSRLNNLETMLTHNRIWKQRLIGIGIVSQHQALDWEFSGVMLRGSGVCWDIRIQEPYDNYDQLEFKSYYGNYGDCYDRYLIRILEMYESNKIIQYIILLLRKYYEQKFWLIKDDQKNFYKVKSSTRKLMKKSMESLIHHFKFFIEGYIIPQDDLYYSIEAPKGEFGVYLCSNNTNRPYRCKIKSPGFSHLQSLNQMVNSSTIADVVTVIGSQDIVFGEIDR